MTDFYVIHDHDVEMKKRGALRIHRDQLSEHNKNGFGIFHTVNDFGGKPRREENLKRLRFLFVDIDGGDKVSMLDKFIKFKHEPSWLVETKNGYHGYWKLEQTENIELYKNILSGLVDEFKADPNGKGVTRILRTPGYFHNKNPNEPFLVKEIYRAENKYTLEDFRDLIQIPEKKPAKIKTGNDDFWEKVYDLDCENALLRISGARECNGDTIEIKPKGEKKAIYVNDEIVQSCWIDNENKIGSHSGGGPTIANWIAWYGHDWDEVAKILKKYFPELVNQDLDILWGW